MLPLQEKMYFVAAVGTSLGKTYLTTQICRNLISNKQKVNAIKPIASGFKLFDRNSDTSQIIVSLQREINPVNIQATTPWSFEEEASSHYAAKINGLKIDFLEVVEFCQKNIILAKENNEFLFIEGAGGLMSPITYDKSFLDLAEELKVPIILITANYLGAISHTLTAIEVLKFRKIKLEVLVINDSSKLNNNSLQKSDANDMQDLLGGYTSAKIIQF